MSFREVVLVVLVMALVAGEVWGQRMARKWWGPDA